MNGDKGVPDEVLILMRRCSTVHGVNSFNLSEAHLDRKEAVKQSKSRYGLVHAVAVSESVPTSTGKRDANK